MELQLKMAMFAKLTKKEAKKVLVRANNHANPDKHPPASKRPEKIITHSGLIVNDKNRHINTGKKPHFAGRLQDVVFWLYEFQ